MRARMPFASGTPRALRQNCANTHLTCLVENHPDVKIARKLTRDAYALRDQSLKYTRAKPEPGAKQAMRQEAKDMLREARQIEEPVIESISARRVSSAPRPQGWTVKA